MIGEARPLTHAGQCGRRERCWREACRAEYRDARTVEVLDNGERIARCHRARWHPRPVELVA